MELVVSVTASEIFGHPPTLEDANELLSTYQRESVLLLLAKLSAVTKSSSFRPSYDMDGEIARMFFKKASEARYVKPADGVPRLFFTRVGILATARLALTACGDKGQIVSNPQDVAAVLTCCLIMNELVTSSIPATKSSEFLTHQLPYANATVQYDFITDAVRSLEIFDMSRMLAGSCAKAVDLEAEFTRAVKISPRTCIEMCLLVATRWGSSRASLENSDFVFLDKTFLRNTVFSDQDLAHFFSVVTGTPAELAAEQSSKNSRSLADITVFQARPLIRSLTEDRYFCIDVAALMEKMGRGLYWTLYGAADERTRKQLGGAYGLAFEAYLHSRLRDMPAGGTRYIESPMFANGDQLCDGLFVEGSELVVCEFKSSVLRADAKCSGRGEVLFPELQKKFVTGDETGPKGVAQFERGIAKLLAGEEVIGLPPQKWRLIRPVMVTLDSAMTCAGMSAYLNDHFDRGAIRSQYRTAIAPLIIIDVREYELLLPDIAAYGFSELLESYWRTYFKPVADQFYKFTRANIPFLKDKSPLEDYAKEKFTQLVATLPRLFRESGEKSL